MLRSILVCCSLMFFNSGPQYHSNQKSAIDSAFVSWNNVTFLSLKNRIKTSDSKKKIEAYKNQLSALRALIEVKNEKTVNRKSIRYQFLSSIGLDLRKNDFYVIETLHSGEVVQLINYLVQVKGQELIIKVFQYNEYKWKNIGKSKINLGSERNFLKLFSETESGFNNGDVIVSQFKNQSFRFSGYYLYKTLINNEVIKTILSLR